MKINYFLLSLGTASVLGYSATTLALTDPEIMPEDRETITRIIPSNDPGLPPIILIKQRDAAKRRAETENKKESPIIITVAPNDRNVPVGIEFTEREEPEEAVASSQRPIEYGAPARDIDPLQSVVNASALLESAVRSRDGVPIGMVEDFIINKDSGRIDLVAIGPGESLRLVQPQALEPSEGQNDFTLNISAARWENAPSVPTEQIDQIALQEKVREVHDYYRPGNQFQASADRDRSTMRERPSAPEQGSATRSELSEQAFADAREALSERSSGPSLHQSRLRQSSRATDQTNGMSSAVAEEEPIEYGAANREKAIADVQGNLVRAREILGESVESEGREFAHVSDLIADLNVGYLQHVIITRDDNGAASYAIPLQQLEIGDGEEIEFLGDPSKLDNAPEFNARMARLHRYEPFRYDIQQEQIQYGAPEQREPAPPADSSEPMQSEQQPNAIDQE